MRAQEVTLARHLVAFALVATGCISNTLRSEGGQADIELVGVQISAIESLRADMPVLEGSQTQLRVSPALCFAPSGEGQVTIVDDVATFGGPGDARIALSARPCDALPDAVDDGLSLRVIGRDAVTFRRIRPQERFGLIAHDAGELRPVNDATTALVRRMRPADGQPVHLLDGGVGTLQIMGTADGSPVMVGRGVGQFGLRGVTGGRVVPDGPLGVRFTGVSGAGDLVFAQSGSTVSIAPWATVPPEDLQRLQIGAAVAEAQPGELMPSMGLVAFVTDSRDRRVEGVPVAWKSLNGRDMPGGVEVTSDPILEKIGWCAPPSDQPQSHTVDLEARFGDLSDRVTFEVELPAYSGSPEDLEAFLAFQREICPPMGLGGCGCASSGAPAWLAALPLAFLVLRRRALARGARSRGATAARRHHRHPSGR
jgi:uncharacterized protein (TIGR03382 family)